MGASIVECPPGQTPVLRLIALAGELSGARGRAAALADLFGLDETTSDGGSTLNGDGSPVQLLARSTAAGVGYRLITDPGFRREDSAARLVSAQGMLASVLPLTRSGGMRDSIERMFAICLPPPGGEGWSELDRGVAWIGAALERDGVVVYVDASHGRRSAAWSRVHDWLTAALPSGRAYAAAAAIDALAQCGEVAGAAVEGVDEERARLKLYWRLCEPVRLDRVGIGPLASAALPVFLRQVAGDSEFPLRALTGSVAFDAVSGELVDAKLDLCGCPGCLDLSADRLAAATADCCHAFGLRLPALAGAIARGESRGALIGMGCNRQGALRLNLYAGPQSC